MQAGRPVHPFDGQRPAIPSAVVIDETRDSEAQVPESFTEIQWTKLPASETPPAFCERVKKILIGPEARSIIRIEVGRLGNQVRNNIKVRPQRIRTKRQGARPGGELQRLGIGNGNERTR
jgi:hypothetical protein